MKLKPIYLYLFVIIVALITLITISNSNDTSNSEMAAVTENIPDDEIHNNITGQSEIGPTRSNVNQSIIDEMNDLGVYVDANPNDTLKIKEYADLLAMAHNEDKALELYNRILSIDKNRTDVITSLAIMYYNKSDFSQSKMYIERILRINPEHVEAKYNLGLIEARLGDMEAAKKQWEDLQRNHPNTKMSDMAKESLEKLKNNN